MKGENITMKGENINTELGRMKRKKELGSR